MNLQIFSLNFELVYNVLSSDHGEYIEINHKLRMKIFEELGADILFIEGPQNKKEMKKICSELKAPKMINLVEGGDTPILSYKELEDMGYSIAAFPLTILSASMKATQKVLNNFKNNITDQKGLMSFDEMQKIIGFKDYFSLEKKYVKSKDNE